MSSVPETFRRVVDSLQRYPLSSQAEKLNAREKERYVQEMEREVGFTPLTTDRVRKLDYFFGPGDPDYRKIIYSDHPIVELVEQDDSGEPRIKLAERSYHEATWGPIADNIASEAKSLLLRFHGESLVHPTALELHTGAGSLTYSLSQGDFQVRYTVERNSTLLHWAEGNLRNLGIDGNIGFIQAEAMDFVERVASDGERFDIALADPPMRMAQFRELSTPSPYEVELEGRTIVRELFKVAPIVGLKIPDVLRLREVGRLADSLNAGGILMRHNLRVGNITVCDNIVFFVRDDVGLRGVEQEQFDLSVY